MLRKNNSIGLLFNGMNERVCSGKEILSATFIKKWMGMLRKKLYPNSFFTHWTGMLRKKTLDLVIMSIFSLFYGRTNIKNRLLCLPQALTTPPNFWTGMLRNMYFELQSDWWQFARRFVFEKRHSKWLNINDLTLRRLEFSKTPSVRTRVHNYIE